MSNYRLVRTNPDGDCLFHAIEKGLKNCGIYKYSLLTEIEVSKKSLRDLCCYFVLKRPWERILDLKTIDMIKLYGFTSAESYIQSVSTQGYWGGELEIVLLSYLFSITITVFQKDGSITYNKGKEKKINLVYSGKHYDVILLDHSH